MMIFLTDNLRIDNYVINILKLILSFCDLYWKNCFVQNELL